MPPTLRPSWRPDLFVVARFLERLHHEEGQTPPRWTKSRLQPAVRLNYDLFQRYLAFLQERGFVTIEERQTEKHVRLTDAGRQAHARLVGWIQDVFGPEAFGSR